MLKNLIENGSRWRYAQLYVVLLALVVSVLFTLMIFPRVSGSEGLLLDPDGYGNLGMSIWKNHVYSFYPDIEPTVARGPGYPAIMALLLTVTNGAFPLPVQLTQCVLFALTCLFVYRISIQRWNRQVAIVAGTICAVHPVLFWFAPRLWVESLAMFLFTAVALSVVALIRKPGVWRGFGLGVLIGVGALCKSTFLPLLVLLPVALCIKSRKSLPMSVALMFGGMLVIAPWTVRNYVVTKTFIPVHAMSGINVLYGDYVADGWNWDRFSLPVLSHCSQGARDQIERGLGKGTTRSERELARDEAAVKMCLARYKAEPLFVVKKLLVQSLLFWTLGDTPRKSLVISVMQIPLLLLFIVATVMLWRSRRMDRIASVHLMMVVTYFLLHLPFTAQNRYSVVLVPLMLVYVVGGLFGSALSDRSECELSVPKSSEECAARR